MSQSEEEQSIQPTPIIPQATDDPIIVKNDEDEIVSEVVEDKFRTFIESVSLKEMEDILIRRRDILGENKFKTAVGESGSYENIASTLLGEHSAEADRERDSIESIVDKSLFSTKLIHDGKTILGNQIPNRDPGRGKLVSGADAKSAVAIREGRMKRVNLYNSGFIIDINQPNLSELNLFFNRAQDLTNSYGRQFGCYFFYYNGLIIEEALVELIQPLIRNSTLHNWNRGKTLLSNIKHNDLRVILNALGALMFKDGFKFTHVCSNPTGTCTHHEELLIDINKLTHHDFRKLSDANITHMSRRIEATQSTLADYHKGLGFVGREIRHGQFGFILQVPSILDHLEYGQVFNSALLSNTFVNNPSETERSLLFAHNRILTPYVSKLVIYEDNGDVDVITTDREVIADTLAHIQESDTEFSVNRAFDDYIRDTEISHICYPAPVCPACGHTPASGYITVDPVRTFFIQSIMKLNKS